VLLLAQSPPPLCSLLIRVENRFRVPAITRHDNAST
jgi:hypothetical protein